MSIDYNPINKQLILERYISYLKENNCQNILDIGPGDGDESRKFLENGINVVAIGVDDNEKIYGLSKQHKNFTFIIKDLNKGFVLDDYKFDAIWSSHCLEHVNSPFDFLKNCWYNLKDNGLLCIVVPPFKHEVVDQHIFVGWNVGYLMTILLRNGFSIKDGKFTTSGYNVAAIVKKDKIESIIGDCGNTKEVDPIWLRKYADKFPDRIRNEIMKNADGTSWFNGNIGDLNW